VEPPGIEPEFLAGKMHSELLFRYPYRLRSDKESHETQGLVVTGEILKDMSVIHAEFAPGFDSGHDAVLLAMDDAGVSDMLAAVRQEARHRSARLDLAAHCVAVVADLVARRCRRM
jgi:hypothetical protein